MTYVFKYKKVFFWSKIVVVGHRLQESIDRMDLYLKDGSIHSIGQWSKYDLKLGTDWVLFTKNSMEKESGQDIKLRAEVK